MGELVGALARKQVFSRKQLAAQWGQDADYLQPELRAWLRKVSANQLPKSLVNETVMAFSVPGDLKGIASTWMTVSDTPFLCEMEMSTLLTSVLNMLPGGNRSIG